YRDFMDACAIFTQVKEPHYYLFVKSGYTKDVQEQAAVDGAKLLVIDDLFSILNVGVIDFLLDGTLV
ncbi:MAG: hypothetical protein ACI4S9_07660, partial [Christensenellales bacterium]